ncbi:MAG: hypothetical protein ACW96X_08730 [Promethearchaeota archaeon]
MKDFDRKNPPSNAIRREVPRMWSNVAMLSCPHCEAVLGFYNFR